MWERIAVIVRKEIRQALREPRMRVILFLPPVMQLIIFGLAVNLDLEYARVAWFDQDRTPESRELLSCFEGSGSFRVVQRPSTDLESRQLLDRGAVLAVIAVLPGFARDLRRGHTAHVQVLVDGANSNEASIVTGYTNLVLRRFATQRAGLPAPPVDARTRIWFNPALRSRNYFVPGVIMNIIAIVTLMLTAMAIVREKEIGTMEQLMVTPVRAFELMIGKTLPFAMIGLVDMLLVTVAARLVFHMPFVGSPWLLLVCALLFLMTTLGAGLFISTVSHTQQQAMMSTFFFFMPALMLSGFAFPVRNMPEVVQWMTALNPLRYFIETIRGVLLKGVGIEVLWPQMLMLAVLGAGVLTGSVLRFHKRLE